RIIIVILAVLVVIAAGTATLVNSRLSARPFDGPPSDHFDGERFTNLDSVPDKSLGAVLKWQATAEKGPWSDWIDEPAGPKPPERVSDGTIRITWINHATLLLQLDGMNILTDPIYSERASPVSWIGPKRHRNPGIRFEDLPPIDLVVVSHNHYDHMDVPTLKQLNASGDTPILVGLGNTAYLAERGVRNTRDVDWWDSTRIGTVRATAVPVQHWSARGRGDRRRTLWAGYVIEGPSGRVYFGGDSGYGRHFSVVHERFGPIDVALLPIGAYRPIWFMKDHHMSPPEAVRASDELGARLSIPMHFDTFQMGDDGEQEPLLALENALVADVRQRAIWRIARHGIAEVTLPR
ncbi:MAG: MBL fold metallo-hydrolase, partial [Gemmatimonadaceae bacterium]